MKKRNFDGYKHNAYYFQYEVGIPMVIEETNSNIRSACSHKIISKEHTCLSTGNGAL